MALQGNLSRNPGKWSSSLFTVCASVSPSSPSLCFSIFISILEHNHIHTHSLSLTHIHTCIVINTWNGHSTIDYVILPGWKEWSDHLFATMLTEKSLIRLFSCFDSWTELGKGQKNLEKKCFEQPENSRHDWTLSVNPKMLRIGVCGFSHLGPCYANMSPPSSYPEMFPHTRSGLLLRFLTITVTCTSLYFVITSSLFCC